MNWGFLTKSLSISSCLVWALASSDEDVQRDSDGALFPASSAVVVEGAPNPYLCMTHDEGQLAFPFKLCASYAKNRNWVADPHVTQTLNNAFPQPDFYLWASPGAEALLNEGPSDASHMHEQAKNFVQTDPWLVNPKLSYFMASPIPALFSAAILSLYFAMEPKSRGQRRKTQPQDQKQNLLDQSFEALWNEVINLDRSEKTLKKLKDHLNKGELTSAEVKGALKEFVKEKIKSEKHETNSSNKILAYKLFFLYDKLKPEFGDLFTQHLLEMASEPLGTSTNEINAFASFLIFLAAPPQKEENQYNPNKLTPLKLEPDNARVFFERLQGNNGSTSFVKEEASTYL